MEDQVNAILTGQEKEKPSLKKFMKVVFKIFLFIFLFFGILVFSFVFLFSPHQVYQGDNILFRNKSYYFSEKLTFLLRSPEVGDRVVFLDSRQSFSEFVGLIVEKRESNNTVNYYILSKQNSSLPWVISADQIKGRIYYPPLPKGVVENTLVSKSWLITPTPELPISGLVKYEYTSPPADWLKYESKSNDYIFYYPKELKEEVNSAEFTSSFSLIEKASDYEGFMEIFIKRKKIEEGKSLQQGMIDEVGLSPIPTFQKVLIADSVSGFQIERSVDNNTRLLTQIYLPRERYLYVITMRMGIPSKDFRYKDIFKQVISTFRFQ